MAQETERILLGRDQEKQKRYYTRLHRKLIAVTLICSLVPLLLVGWAINIRHNRFAKARMADSFQMQADYHKRIIELFLKRSTHKLILAAQTHSKDFLKEMRNLAHVFAVMNLEFGSLTDLGVIDHAGRHLAYVGPYDLMDKVYSDQPWFKQVMESGVYISDMFMGFREVPHFIIAVTREEGDEKWILRATIDTEAFRSLVENVRVGRTGQAYLLNEEGFYQTSPPTGGEIMGKSDSPLQPFHEGIRVRVKEASPGRIIATAWLREPRWMLVVEQGYAEALDEVNYTKYATLILLHLSALIILAVTILVTRRLLHVIRNRDMETDRLSMQLIESGKMASLGELSAGVAHEINNPLAIILTERQILLDLAERNSALDETFKKDLKESLDQVRAQITRCKNITHSLLRFSRRTKSVIEEVDLNTFLGEIVQLMEREAHSSGIAFMKDFDPNLKPILSDPSQLQQVFLNLFTNAVDAHEGKSSGAIRIATKGDHRNQRVRVTVADKGSGIPGENLERIFDPFFTTKPVGKGTGLGLSICYSIVQHLGGTIGVRSEMGEGTEFMLDLPFNPPMKLRENGT